MRWVLLGAIGLGFGSLAMARYIPSDAWVHFLMATGGFLGLALAMAAAMLVRRWAASWKPIAAMILAVAAAITRSRLLERVSVANPDQVKIDFIEISLAISTMIWGTLALIWGTLSLNDLMVAGGPRRSMIPPALAVSLALYSISPLLGIYGLQINMWTILCLFGLAAIAYGLGTAYRWFAGFLGAE